MEPYVLKAKLVEFLGVVLKHAILMLTATILIWPAISEQRQILAQVRVVRLTHSV